MKYHSKRGTKTWYPRWDKRQKKTRYMSFRKGLKKRFRYNSKTR